MSRLAKVVLSCLLLVPTLPALAEEVQRIRPHDQGEPQLDLDSDGIEDSVDNCSQLFNPDQTDTDGDGFGDACDQDDDGDGIRDADGGGSLACPTTDTCLPDAMCSLGGNDCSGPADCVAEDQPDFCIQVFGECSQSKAPCAVTADCPPLVDTCERSCDESGEPCTSDAECTVSGCDDNCPLMQNPMQTDTDSDGVGDVCDNCPNDDNPGQENVDGDADGDACDLDVDGDGQPQDIYGAFCSLVPNGGGFPINPAPFTCTDGATPCWNNTYCPAATVCPCDDNCPSDHDPSQFDHDGDLVGSVCDNCLEVPNPGQEDNDFDSLGNSCDNCIDAGNPNQENDDQDDFGNACDNCKDVGNNSQGDSDFDDVGNVCDNCPMAFNPSQFDDDSDGDGDVCDPCPFDDDRDGDFLCSGIDNCPGIYNPGQADQDGDGIGNPCDCDRDGDGVGDKISYPEGAGSIACGVCIGGGRNGDSCDRSNPNCPNGTCRNYLSDHCSSIQCYVDNTIYPACGLDQGLFQPCTFQSLDLPCCLDNCSDTPNGGQANDDGDSRGNACDASPAQPQTLAESFPLIDFDGDTHLNAVDNCYQQPNYPQFDADVDLQGDVCDNDLDGDAVANAVDNCVAIPNAGQLNADLDSLGDPCDNCPLETNPAQTDVDQDGLGDRCDSDDERLTLSVDSGEIAAWDPETGFTQWILLYGDLEVLKATGNYVQAPGALAGAVCQIPASADLSGIAVPPGRTVFFLSGGFVGGDERGFGNRSSGTQRVVAEICE